MDFKTEYFNIWTTAWNFHKKHYDVAENEEQRWQQLIAEADLEGLEGFKVAKVRSDKYGQKVSMKLINDKTGVAVKIFFDDVIFGTEFLKYTEWQTNHGNTDKKEVCRTPTQ